MRRARHPAQLRAGAIQSAAELASPSIRRFSYMGSLAYIENLAGRVEHASAGRGVRHRVPEHRPVQRRLHRHVRVPAEAVRDRADGVTLPVGGYDYDNVRVGWNLGLQRSVSGNFLAEYGTFYSGTRTALGVSRGRVSVSSQLALEPTYTVNWVDLAEGSFTTHLAGARVTYTMSPACS